MRKATSLAVVALAGAGVGWYLGGGSSVRAETNAISALSVVEVATNNGIDTRIYMVRYGQLLVCNWQVGEQPIGIQRRDDGFVCAPVRVRN